MFSGCTVPPDRKETELGSSNQEASLSAGKNTRIVLVPCCPWKCVPTATLGGADISKVPGCHLLWQMSFQRGSQKLPQGLVSHELKAAYLSVFNSFLTQWIMAILSKGCKSDNFVSCNSLNSVLWIFEAFVQILLIVNLSLNQTLLTFLWNKPGWINRFWQFLFEGLSFKKIILFICMLLQLMWRKYFLLHGTYL